MTDPKVILERVTDYRDSLLHLVDQLGTLAAQLPEPGILQDGIKLYSLVAGDLTTLLQGKELKPFMVTGILPDDARD
jgi:hypothetical protein